MGDPSKRACPSVNLVVRDLLLDCDSSLKIGVVVAEDWPTWGIVLPSLGYQVLKICAPERFRKSLQVGTLSGAECLTPNQARRLGNLQDSCFFVSIGPSFVIQ